MYKETLERGILYPCLKSIGTQKIVRTILVIILLSVCFVPISVYGQDARVSINVQNKPLSEVIETIKNQTGYSFWFDSNDLNANQLVTINVANQSVKEVLKTVLAEQKVTFKMTDNHIVLEKMKQNDSNASTKSAKQLPKKVTGTVVDKSGEALIGVSISIKGTQTATMADSEGKFTIDASNDDTLLFSYVGFVNQEIKVGDKNTFDVKMEESDIQLGDVVVTALGIRKEVKSLTYNVQEVKANQITAIKDPNFINSLAGKVAGVQINSSSSGIGGSSRVIMRGTKSFMGNNNALYVIDGIPQLSTKSSQPADVYESPDGGDGDGIALINPDDIESMSVLTGAAAAALYGSQGSNGVILVTTRKGESDKMRINYSNGTSFMSPLVMPKFQNTYGSEPQSFMSWGQKLTTPSDYKPKDFFQTGFNETNSLSVSRGTETNQTYISVATLNARGIIPNNTLNRYNLNFRQNTELVKDKLFLDFGASYVKQDDKNMMAQGQYHNPLMPIYLFPLGDDIQKYKVYERYDAERNFKTQFWPYGNMGLGMQNPYWIVNRELFENTRERYSYNITLKYNILDWMNIMGRGRMDNSENKFTRKIYASSDKLFASDKGNYLNRKKTEKQLYLDAILNMDKRIDKWTFTSNIGASLMDGKNDAAGFEGHLVTVPNLFSYQNIDRNDPETKFIEHRFHDQSKSIFATAQVGYKSLVYLDVTARNEWPSQLAFSNSSSYFFPSVGFTGIISDMVTLPKNVISFAKVRGSYSEVGNPPSRYLTSMRYQIEQGVISMLPIFPNKNLKAERTKAFEVGTNLRFLKDKINFDLTYYNSNTYNQVLEIESPPSTGYKSYFLNTGKVNNWGFEASLSYNEKLGPIDWTSSLTYSFNKNEIKELISDGTINPITGEVIRDIDEFTMNSSGSYKMVLRKGGTMGDIYVSTLKKDHHGYVKVDPESGTVEADPQNWIKAGSVVPKFNTAWRNSFSFKDLELGFLITARVGGVGVSATQALMDRYGVSKKSAIARDEGGVLVNGSRVNPKGYYAVTGGGTTGVLSENIYSMTNVRLKELSLGYTLPRNWYKGYINRMTVSLIGSNLLMFYNKAPFDPEITASTGTYYQGLDYFMPPSLRNVGFSVKVQF